MIQQLSALENVPLSVSLGQNAGEVMPLKYQKASTGRNSPAKTTHEHSIPTAKDVQTVWFVVTPFSVDVLAMCQIGQSRPLQSVLVPVGNVERKFIVNEDSQPVPLLVCVDRALILTVTVVEYLAVHI